MSSVQRTVVIATSTDSVRPLLLWERNAEELDRWVQTEMGGFFHTKRPPTLKCSLSPSSLLLIWKTLETALSSVIFQSHDGAMAQPSYASLVYENEKLSSKKRRKTIKQARTIVDPFNIWFHGNDKGTPTTAGGTLSELTVGGLLNGMAGVSRGVTDAPQPTLESISLEKLGAQLTFKMILSSIGFRMGIDACEGTRNSVYTWKKARRRIRLRILT